MGKPKGYWTKERCFEAARECSTIREFCTKYGAAYKYSDKNGWLDEFFPKAA